MSADQALRQLDDAIASADPADRPGLVVGLAARLAQLGAGMAATAAVSAAGAQGSGGPGGATENLEVAEAARRLGVSSSYLYRHAQALPFTVRIGRRLLFNASALEKYVKSRTGR
jgi:excisionase family DNA binding protein